MNKKSFLVLLILSIIVTYAIAIVDVVLRNSLLMGEAGLPLRFSSASFLGESTNHLNLLFDVAFWFLVLLLIKQVLKKIHKKR